MTDEQIEMDARKFAEIERRTALKARTTELHRQLESHAESWLDLSKNVRDCDDYNTIAVDGNSITITRPSDPAFPTRNGTTIVAKVPVNHFDIEVIRRLITDLEETKKELSEAAARVGSFGLGL
jgi:hypothetical protein